MPDFSLRLNLPVVSTSLAVSLPRLPVSLNLSGYADQHVRRSIDPDVYNFEAEVTIEEDSDDELEITQHPVEYGAAISDHAYKRPAEVRVRVGWSNAYVSDVRTVYEDILALQKERRPFDLVTGKRDYSEMLVASVRVHTDAKTEYSMIADITFRQIIRVSTQTLKSKTATNEKALSEPEKTMSTADQGQRSTTPAKVTTKQAAAAGAPPPRGSAQALIDAGGT